MTSFPLLFKLVIWLVNDEFEKSDWSVINRVIISFAKFTKYVDLVTLRPSIPDISSFCRLSIPPNIISMETLQVDVRSKGPLVILMSASLIFYDSVCFCISKNRPWESLWGMFFVISLNWELKTSFIWYSSGKFNLSKSPCNVPRWKPTKTLDILAKLPRLTIFSQF